jgi:hypothetical protein
MAITVHPDVDAEEIGNYRYIRSASSSITGLPNLSQLGFGLQLDLAW